MMKLWIDDVRPPPVSENWWWAKTSADALGALETLPISEISFDHDLGGVDTTMPVALEIERRAHDEGIRPPIWHIHSANPVGRMNLEATLKRAEAFAAHKVAS